MPKKKVDIHWLNEPEDHDYPAAASYLSLIYDEDFVKAKVALLKLTPVSQFKAKDIFRGYHRLCAIYFFDEDAVIPCKIV